MNKRKTTKKSFIIAAVSFMLTVLLMMGATFAWFTARRTSGTNTIKTADFNVTLQYSSDCENWTDLDNTSVLFNNVTLVPGGNTEIVYLKVTNTNNYAVDASMTFKNASNQSSMTLTPDTIPANYDELKLYKNEVTAATDVDTLKDTTAYSLAAAADILGSKTLAEDESVIIAVLVALPDNATVPGVTATFNITLGATQAHS